MLKLGDLRDIVSSTTGKKWPDTLKEKIYNVVNEFSNKKVFSGGLSQCLTSKRVNDTRFVILEVNMCVDLVALICCNKVFDNKSIRMLSSLQVQSRFKTDQVHEKKGFTLSLIKHLVHTSLSTSELLVESVNEKRKHAGMGIMQHTDMLKTVISQTIFLSII